MKSAPVWAARFPRSRRPSYPRFRGEGATRVAIVGGGLTGAACALSFAAAGIDVVLLEANIIGSGRMAGRPGVLREGFAGSFHEVASTYGLRTARALWDTMRRGSLDFAAALKRYRIKCGLEPRELITIAAGRPEATRSLRREYEARRAAAIDSAWMSPAAVTREAGLESGGGIRTRGFVVDPYRACVGLIQAAATRGARVHEHSRVERIRGTKSGLELRTPAGTLRADAVVIATAAPLADLRSLRRHLRADHFYGVVTDILPSAVRRQVGKRHSVIEEPEPHRFVRWMADDTTMVVGGRQPQVPERGRERALVQRTGQLMYELSLLYPAISGIPAASSWDGVDYETADGLPFIGRHRRFPHHLFAFGSVRHGAGFAWTAARILLRDLQGEPLKTDRDLGFQRIL